MPSTENGLTFWDFLLKLFKNPKTLIAIFSILIILIVTLILMGFLNYDGKGFHIGKMQRDGSVINISKIDSLDYDLQFCILEARKRGLDYVTDNILVNVDVDYLNKDTLIEKVRISYTIRALKDLKNSDFTEKYSTSSNGFLKHVFGTDREELSGTGNFYDIKLNMHNQETKTILTGCDYFFNYPLQANRNEVAGDIPVNSKQDVYIYPNEEDVIKNITIRVASNSLNIRPMASGARLYKDGAIIRDNPFLQYDVNGIAKYNSRSISYSWKKLLPKDRVVIYFEWD